MKFPANVFWIGGSPCSGKSTIAETLAAKYGLRLYSCDVAYETHKKQLDPLKQPTFSKIVSMSWNELWMRPVEEQLQDEIALYREEFALILEDIAALPQDKPILAEGAALLPELISPSLEDSTRAAWVIPTKDFQLHHYVRREWVNDILKQCGDPEQAFKNWMQRDLDFAEYVARLAKELDVKLLMVDGSTSLAENTGFIEGHFQLATRVP